MFIKFIAGLISILISPIIFASTACDATELANPHHVLRCYLQSHSSLPDLKLINSQTKDKVEIKTYNFASQVWNFSSPNQGVWQHELVMYKPETLKANSPALLFINGGIRNSPNSTANASENYLDFAAIAQRAGTFVVVLNDIPNQYLQFDDTQWRKEDDAVAYTFSKYLDDPLKNAYWPLYLPMTNAVIETMDAVQALMGNPQLHFVVSGLSKRGWATWLAALQDNKDRIDAIVPIVIDILDTDKNLNLILESCGHDISRKPALYSYANKAASQDVLGRLGTDNFKKLVQIVDPLTYINCNDIDCPTYKKHLSIPKYIISASGDDFFIPDSLKLYVDQLPGETEVRVIPNQSHYIERNPAGKEALQALLVTYIHTLQGEVPRHSLKVEQNGLEINIQADVEPESLVWWEAQNPDAHDFRLAAKITYIPTLLARGENGKQYKVTITPPAKGWKATFFEATFRLPNKEEFTVTTPIYVTKQKN